MNAGDGWHEHPTQALLDCYTIRERFGSLEGLRIAIVGDVAALPGRTVRHPRLHDARAPRSCSVAPPTLLPPSLEGFRTSTVSYDLDQVLPKVDVVYLLRMQTERQHEALVALASASTRRGGGSPRVGSPRSGDDAVVMHPGPMNRGVEIAAEVADLPRSVVIDQVRNGVAVRMAVLYLLLGSGPNGPHQW